MIELEGFAGGLGRIWWGLGGVSQVCFRGEGLVTSVFIWL